VVLYEGRNIAERKAKETNIPEIIKLIEGVAAPEGTR
jgi:hypothetical protein